jgi:hypothetical protein
MMKLINISIEKSPNVGSINVSVLSTSRENLDSNSLILVPGGLQNMNIESDPNILQEQKIRGFQLGSRNVPRSAEIKYPACNRVLRSSLFL